MKILVTGFTARQVGSKRTRIKKTVNLWSLFVRALEQLGHEVDNRKVSLDETGLADQYDLLLLGLAAPNKIGSNYALEALWAQSQFPVERTLWTYDDWQCYQVGPGIKTVRSGWPRWFRWRAGNRIISPGIQTLLAQTLNDRFVVKDGMANVIAPLYSWWNPTAFRGAVPNGGRVFRYDPSPLALGKLKLPDHREPQRRREEWVYATLSNAGSAWVDKQTLEWGIDRLGGTPRGKGGTQLRGVEPNPFVEEDEVTQRYADCWGNLAPPYPKEVTGWWRGRFLQSMIAHGILVTDGADAERTDPELYGIKRLDIERMSNTRRTALAERQAGWLRGKLASETTCLNQIEEALSRYHRGGPRMAKSRTLATVSETVVCPKCSKKTHGTWERTNPERECIHCGSTFEKGKKMADTNGKNAKRASKKTSNKKKTPAKKKAAAKKAPAKKKVSKKKTTSKKASDKKKAAAKKDWKPGTRPKPDKFSDTVGGLISKHLFEGKLTDAQIWQTVKGKYDIDDARKGRVNWYRHHLRSKGYKIPDAKKAKK